MNTQHTSGPWRTSDSGEWTANHDGLGSSCYQGIKDELGNVVALAVAHDPNHFSDPDTQANARLIAAAPELLFELKKCASLLKTAFGETNDLTGKAVIAQRLESVTALIAKATGAA